MEHTTRRITLTAVDVRRSATDGDLWEVMEPMHFTGNFYADGALYERSLAEFTVFQRMLFAMNWMESEVCNGGFDQFLGNSTGMVWADAYAGFTAIGDRDTVDILDAVGTWYGGEPAKDRKARRQRLQQLRETDAHGLLEELDSRFYSDELLADREEKQRAWVKNNAGQFTFDGEIPSYG
ncbi:DUF4375 domain-containing protein [Corynebacterium mendelii]|uniref:DUF4375 domain-containing protein n=1 Tax=Corynebacterium mendelii TaxID=2765362 RepID=A0A939E1Q1_9CORY|nr:DUF4375 domain-containing protein [Corynebacterium mendelii]MBN9644876.1 DUF4375 domain-containing protein [Corynebacterium mendelii]